MTRRFTALIALLAGTLLLPACAAYVTPGRAADMSTFGMPAHQRAALTDAGIQRQLDRQPLARFPTNIAVARVQAPGYQSKTANSYGSGRYSIVTTRDVETPEQFDRLAKLPMISGIAPVNRLLLPQELNTDQDVRQAAAALHADMLLVYTLDTTFQTDDAAVPLTVISLGLFPSKVARVVATASAVLLDTRNGYVYGVAEATAQKERLASAWTSSDAVDFARRSAETEAFGKLVDDMERAWKLVVEQYAATPRAEAK